MNLNDLYEMRDPRDAYERDVANSQAGMGKQSRADVTGEEEPSGVFTIVINGRPWKTGSSNEMFALASRVADKHSDKKVAVKWPTGELNTVKSRDVDEGIVGNMVNKAKSMFTKPAAPAAPAMPVAPAPVVPNAATQARMAAAPQGYDPNTGKPLVAAKAAPGAVAKGGTMAMTKKVTPVAKPAAAKPAASPAAPAAPGGVQGIKSNIDVNTLQKFNGIVDVPPKIKPQIKDAKGRTWTKLTGGWTQDGSTRTIDRQDSTYQSFDDAWRVANGAQPGNVGVPGAQQPVAESSQRVDSLVTDALKIMQGATMNDAVAALKTVLGNREYNDRRGHYNFYVRQLMDMYGQQGVAEADVDSDGHSVDHADSGEYDYEGDQAKDQLNTIVRAARRLDGMLDDNENMPEWVQMKITNAADYIDTAADYIESNQEPELAEGWKETLGAAALTGAMALGAGGAQARVMPGDDPGINRLTGKPIATQQATDTAPTQSMSSINLAKPQAQYDVDTRILTYKGKQYKWNSDAQATGQGEVVTAPSMAVGSRSMGSTKVELNPNGTYTRVPANESQEKVGNMDADKFDAAMARLKQLAGAGPLKTVYDPTKRVYRNVPTAVQPRK
jgi:hypothetical protein